MALNILVAPSGFKEGLDAPRVAAAIARGAARALPSARIDVLPLMDGGEGFTRALVKTTNGLLHRVQTTDPLGRAIEAEIGLLGQATKSTAVIEIAAAAGLLLVAPAERDLARASSAGVGRLIRQALDLGARRILVGCGDSGVNDGGAGLVRMLGARLLDHDGHELGEGALPLRKLARIDVSDLDPRLAACEIEVAVNWKNVLTGPRGVSRIYGPQKGASPELVEQLDDTLCVFARRVYEATGRDVAALPGAGASGGIGAALAGLCGATLIPRFEVVRRYLPFDEKLAGADLLITAEGGVDAQSARGKIPAEVASRARALGIPVILLAGSIGDGVEALHAVGVSACFCIAQGPMSLAQSMQNAERLLEATAAQAVRSFHAGFCFRTGLNLARDPSISSAA
ncbi:glycerate kinase [Hyphomicrobium sp.]|uniref:glycerate kinase family protein n=1 Tax=Hyphomicrobium sp. TaxID=82 RepID=UPI0025BC1F20|nr:glycerate kinase [Hyphomicrobium sp.]MCC7250969.1 glycerate kinase [Hyphomicrobium sp.]